ncbi:hypothetical protein [Mesorhizobium sp. M0203]|uniref:hypothetical protein n=1 Tax=Mesorhizobium sp. M0203 TaxID=2956912 RepID=UPI00333E11C9
MNHKPLASAFSKIERAKTHIQDLNARIEAFFGDNPYEISSHVDSKRCEEIWEVRLTKPIPPAIFNIIEDAVHNIRAPLDKMLSAYAVRNGKSPRGVWFPIADTLQQLKKPDSQPRRGIKKLPQQVYPFILKSKPYKRGNPLLWWLHQIDIGDKHWDEIVSVRSHPTFRLKRLAVYYGVPLIVGSKRGHHLVQEKLPGCLELLQQAGKPMAMFDIGPTGHLEFGISEKTVKTGYEFLTTTPGAKFKIEFHPSFEITLRQIPGFEREPVVSTLNQMRDLVERLLITFEKRFFS